MNHFDELNNKTFISKYFVKRFARLYKAYVGYTLLAFVPLYCISYISIKYLNLKFDGITHFQNNLNTAGLFSTLVGDNIVSYQLWYLIALILITSICFSIIYYFKIKTLFYFGIPLLIFDIIFWDSSQHYSTILFETVVYMPAYIFGLWYGYNKVYQKKTSVICAIPFLILFGVSIIYSTSIIYKYAILLFSFTFPPFMIMISNIILNNNLLKKPLLICGKYSFPIYLFHWPIILPVISRGLIDILNLNYFITPYIIALLAVIVCIFVYKICVQFRLNRMFE